MIDVLFTLVCFIAGYLLKLCHVGLQLKTSHPIPGLGRICNTKSGPLPDLKNSKQAQP